MKKISFLFVATIATFMCLNSAKADYTEPQWVSTEVQKKNVILEEYTGWQCTWCPDGHRIANQLAKANPGRVFPVNIHAGSFATPMLNAYGWDLRTPEGTALANASGLSGYPAGSVNRATNPWATNRGEWASRANQIMAQNSPVNVFTKASINVDTRKLIVEVEIYYTANSAASTNKLTVMLLQNEIIGAQVDGGPSFPEMHVATIDPNQRLYLYRHQHALRKFISSGGAFGEDITGTNQGRYHYKKYELDVPEMIIPTNVYGELKDVVELANLEVLAFVAEGNSNIYTGHSADIEFIGNFVELALTDKTTYPSSLKLGTVTPTVEIKNNAGKAVTSFDVRFYVNGNLIQTKSFNGNLAVNATTTVDFNAVNFNTGGSFNFFYDIVSPKNDNNDLYFIDKNAYKSNAFSGLIEKAIVTGTLGFNGTTPPNTLLTGANSRFFMANNAQTPYGANNTTGAVVYYLHSSWGNANIPGYMMFGEVDFETIPNKVLSYYYAYSDGGQGGTAPKIVVEISENWGATWTKINEITCESTGNPANPENLYVPVSSHYKKVEVKLNEYANKNSIIRVGGVPGTSGNALWIDEITLSEETSVPPEYTVTIGNIYPAGAGTVSGAGGPFPAHSSVTLTATPTDAEEYEFKNWTDANGAVISEANPYTFTITKDMVLNANFNVLSIKDEHISLNSFFPNPAKDYLTIDLKENATVKIFTLDGIKLFEETRAEGLSNINFTVPVGTYILRTETPKGSAATKFIVE